MPTSDEDLQRKADEVTKLREQVSTAEAQRLDRETSKSNDLAMVQLETEEAQLRARLARAKNEGKAGAVNEGVDAPLGAAKVALKEAVAQQKAAEDAKEPEGTIPTSTPADEVAAAIEKQKDGNN